MSSLKIIAHIPARYGSVRLKVKNLQMLDGKPLISYAIRNAQGSKRLTDFYVNTESDQIGQVAESFGAKVFQRDPSLSSEDSTQDHFNYDFISKMDMDILVLVNPVCPLIDSADIDAAIDMLLQRSLDTVVSATSSRLHAFFDGKPLNFDPSTVLPKTQDIQPVLVCNWAIGVWRARAFKEQYEKQGHATFVGEVGHYLLPASKAVKISDAEDFKMAEALIRGRIHES